jgi:hypothetical protein
MEDEMNYKAQQVLYTSDEMHGAIKHVLSDPFPGEERVVIVAYLGDGAEAYLPNPKGLKIVCALQAPATSPEAIDRLCKREALVLKSNRLHMKVYWSSRKGCVIGSANASDNALGKNGLKEAGVFLPEGIVDIERLLRVAKPSEITSKEMRLLRRKGDAITAALGREPGQSDKATTFLDWFDSKGRTNWKLGWWDDDDVEVAKSAKARALREYGQAETDDMLNVAKGQATMNDWLLCFNVITGADVKWMYVDFVVPVAKVDKKAYEKDFPFQAIQVKSLKRHANPPFQIDAAFKGAFRRAYRLFIERYGVVTLTNSKKLVPPKEWLQMIKNEFG